MLFVWLGVFALFVGPLLVSFVGRNEAASRVLDTFVVVTIGGLVFLHILPESLAEAGWPALGAVLLGATLPTLLHSPLHALHAPCNSRGTRGLLALAGLAMGLHAFFDGVALAPAHDAAAPLPFVWRDHSHTAIAVVLHRLLEGTGLWYLMRPALGRMWALVAMGLLALATYLGCAGASLVIASGGESVMAFVQAAVAGSLLHVLAHHAPGSTQQLRRWAWENLVGLGLALGLLGLLGTLEERAEHACGHAEHHHGSMSHTAFASMLAIAPWVLVALALTAAMHALLPAGLPRLEACAPPSRWQRARAAVGGALRGLVTDTAFARVAGLYAHAEADAQGTQTTPHAATPATSAFLLLAPAFGVTAGLLSFATLGIVVTSWRIAALVAWASVTSLRLGAPTQPKGPAHHVHACTEAAPMRPSRLFDGVHYALGDGVDALGPWLVLALGTSALLEGGLGHEALSQFAATSLDVPLVGLLAAPVYLSPVVASLVGLALWHKGLSMGAVVTFTLCASAVSIVSGRQLARLYGPGRAWASMLGLYGLSVAIGYVVNLQDAAAPPQALAQQMPHLGTVASAIVFGLMALSCLRQGVRAFGAPITAWSMHLGRHHHH